MSVEVRYQKCANLTIFLSKISSECIGLFSKYWTMFICFGQILGVFLTSLSPMTCLKFLSWVSSSRGQCWNRPIWRSRCCRGLWDEPTCVIPVGVPPPISFWLRGHHSRKQCQYAWIRWMCNTSRNTARYNVWRGTILGRFFTCSNFYKLGLYLN